MNPGYKCLIQVAAAVFAVLWAVELCFAALWTARTHPSAKASPDGCYAVYAAWTDKGGFGYAGRIYLVDRRRSIPRLYDTRYIVPRRLRLFVGRIVLYPSAGWQNSHI